VNYEYERVATPSSGLRLHLNENTAGCSPAVVEALRSLTPVQLAEYPDYDVATDATARRLGVNQDSVLLTNGLDEGILVAAMVAFCDPAAPELMPGSPTRQPRWGGRAGVGPREQQEKEAIVVVPAFDMYAACTDAVGGRVIEVPLESDFTFPLERVLAAITDRTRIVWLTNPNNPTGQSIPREAIVHIAEAAKGALVFVDEAYVDFGGSTLIGDAVMQKFPLLIVGRTFAKAYGLAGIRAGAVIGQPETIAALRRVTPPYSLNVCAAVALPAAFGDTAYYDWYLNQVEESKQLLYGALEKAGVAYWKSDANFVLARFQGRGTEVQASLASGGIHIRDRSGDPGCSDCLRITAGVVEHTRKFVTALEWLV
jgi:histidinol-phosphate aminotransferase